NSLQNCRKNVRQRIRCSLYYGDDQTNRFWKSQRRRIMCPICVGNLALMAVGASSTGGLAGLAARKLFFKSGRNPQTNETGERQDENRNNGTENRHERSECF